MKKLNNIKDDKDLLLLIYSSKQLREDFDTYLQDTEMYWVSDVLNHFKESLRDWSIGFYNNNYIRVKDCDELKFCYEAESMGKECDDKITKLASKCVKLYETNLFEYHFKQLKEAVLEWFNSIAKYVEDLSFKIYKKEVDERLFDYVECYRYGIDHLYITNDNKIVSLKYYN